VFDPVYRKRTKVEEPKKKEEEAKIDESLLDAAKAVREACLNGEFGVEKPFIESIAPLVQNLLDSNVRDSRAVY
jgi:hypothetical protein